MKVRIRTTGRKDLPIRDVDIKFENIQNADDSLYSELTHIKVKKNLSGLNDSDLIKLRVKQNKTLEVIDCGTISNPVVPKKDALSKFNDENESINISAMIVDAQNHLIKASFKKPIKHYLKDSNDKETPISFKKKHTEPLLWDLALSEDQKPIIYLSNKIEIIEKITADKVWLSSILPEVLRRIFLFIYDENLWDSDEDWILIFKNLVDNYNDQNFQWFREGQTHLSDIHEWIDHFITAYMQSLQDVLYQSALDQLNLDEE